VVRLGVRRELLDELVIVEPGFQKRAARHEHPVPDERCILEQVLPRCGINNEVVEIYDPRKYATRIDSVIADSEHVVGLNQPCLGHTEGENRVDDDSFVHVPDIDLAVVLFESQP
jgi:hypothetical protein